jgi:hypothetical protein
MLGGGLGLPALPVQVPEQQAELPVLRLPGQDLRELGDGLGDLAGGAVRQRLAQSGLRVVGRQLQGPRSSSSAMPRL